MVQQVKARSRGGGMRMGAVAVPAAPTVPRRSGERAGVCSKGCSFPNITRGAEWRRVGGTPSPGQGVSAPLPRVFPVLCPFPELLPTLAPGGDLLVTPSPSPACSAVGGHPAQRAQWWLGGPGGHWPGVAPGDVENGRDRLCDPKAGLTHQLAPAPCGAPNPTRPRQSFHQQPGLQLPGDNP